MRKCGSKDAARVEDFCARVRQGLEQATFDEKRLLIELLIDRIIVTDGGVEIRYVVPTTRASEQVRFCHLRLGYRTGSPPNQITRSAHARLQEVLQRPTRPDRG